MKPGSRIEHQPSNRKGEALVTFEEDDVAHVDWRPDGQGVESAPQSEFHLD